jgi:hypothetical protein
MVEKDGDDKISKCLSIMEDWYRAVIFTPELKVISSKNYDVKESELK